MRAVFYDRQGPAAEVLRIGDLPRPEPGPGEVRVRLLASGVNPADCKRRAGQGYGMEFPRVIPNSDGAGVVDALGPGAGMGAPPVGARVWLYNAQRGRPFGTAAEFTCVPADCVSPLPDDVPFEAGACLGIPAMTAHRCLFADGPLTASLRAGDGRRRRGGQLRRAARALGRRSPWCWRRRAPRAGRRRTRGRRARTS